MILKGKKKKVLKEIVRYYVESTGNAYEDFISTLQAGKDVVIKDYAKLKDKIARIANRFK